jgi:hypothetical protein
VAELVDALGLGSSVERCGGSSPSERTNRRSRRRVSVFAPAMTNMDTELDFSRCGISRHLKDNSRSWIGKPEED